LLPPTDDLIATRTTPSDDIAHKMLAAAHAVDR
jgi:hypothetical protein